MRSSRGFLVIGRVQGVGFRWWTARQARELNLGGTVRNRPDGSVEVHAHGAPSALTELESRLGVGPRTAWVSVVERLDPPADLPEDFQIIR